MPDFSLDVRGLNKTVEDIAKFPAEFTRKAVKPTLKNVAKEIVLPAAKSDDSFRDRTGKLRRSLKVRTAKIRGKRLPRGVVGYAVTSVVKAGDRRRIGTWVFANRKLRNGVIRKGTRTLRNAIYSNSRRIHTSVRRRLSRQLELYRAGVR